MTTTDLLHIFNAQGNIIQQHTKTTKTKGVAILLTFIAQEGFKIEDFVVSYNIISRVCCFIN